MLKDKLQELNEKFVIQVQNLYGKKMVAGAGPVPAELVLIGEAPGGQEEKLGAPFVGAAGKNLTEFLTTLALERDNLYITNIVKFRPTKLSEKTNQPINRPPTTEEINCCKDFLDKELALVNPKLIVTLGNVPLKTLLGSAKTIGACHGALTTAPSGYKVFPLYHPASIIYNQSLKEVYKEDLLALKQTLTELSLPSRT